MYGLRTWQNKGHRYKAQHTEKTMPPHVGFVAFDKSRRAFGGLWCGPLKHLESVLAADLGLTLAYAFDGNHFETAEALEFFSGADVSETDNNMLSIASVPQSTIDELAASLFGACRAAPVHNFMRS
jgi:hypothetical protein